MRFLSRFAVAAFVGFLVSCLIAVGSYSLGLWLGRNGDNLVRLIYDSIPLALLLGLAALLQPRLKVGRQQGPPIFAVLVGSALGLAYSLVVARRNMAFLSLVVLVLSCWVPSGICAMLAASYSKRISSAIAIVVLCLAAIFLTEPLFNVMAHNQRLTVAGVTPSELSTAQLEANPECLGFDNDSEIQMAKNEVLEHVRALGYTGTFRVLSITRVGKGTKSLAILVLRTPITKEVTLRVPDKTTVVYVQQDNDWDKKPADVSLLRRGITMEPPGATAENRDYKILGYFSVPDAQGVSFMGRVISRASVQSH